MQYALDKKNNFLVFFSFIPAIKILLSYTIVYADFFKSSKLKKWFVFYFKKIFNHVMFNYMEINQLLKYSLIDNISNVESKYINYYGIHSLHTVNIDGDKDIIVLPNSTIDIFISDTLNEQIIMGPSTKMRYTFFKKGHYFLIHFIAGTVPQYKDKEILPIQLYDTIYHISNLEDWQKSLFQLQSFDQQCQMFIQYVKIILIANIHQNKVVSLTMETIYKNKGELNLSDFYNQSGYSKQYINRVFKRYFGKNPKYFCKLIRFQYLIKNMKELYPKQMKLTQIAARSKYYDQSHMNKDFKSFTGLTPEVFIKVGTNQLPVNTLEPFKDIYNKS